MRKKLLLSLVAAVCCMSMWAQTTGPAANEIWYTSSTGEVIEYYFFYDATSNTYKNGKGVATFENAVTEISYEAFSDCTELTSIILPEGLNTIANYAFVGCTELTSIILPEGLETIGDCAFVNTGLTSITIPASVENIGAIVLAGCNDLSSITVEGDNSSFDSRDGCNAIIDKSTNELVAGCNSTIIPNTVESIGGAAFASCSLTSITIPSSVTTIADEAFMECGLQSITIPANVMTIGDAAFGECADLATVTFEENSKLKSIGEGVFSCCGITEIEWPADLDIPTETFEECESLKSVTFAGSITAIEEYAFNGCSALTSITLPEGLESIESAAFAGCGLSSIVIPSTVTFIGDQAFGKTGSADGSITFAEGSEYEVLTNGAFCYTNFGAITLPESLTEIQDYSIDCENLTSLIIPENVTTIGSLEDNWGAAISAPNLKSLTFAGVSKLTLIGESAFSGCSSLSSLVIPASVTTIGQDAFKKSGTADGCLTFAEGSKYTGEGDTRAFAQTSFGTIVLPESMTTLGGHSFHNSTCKSVTIPADVTTIGTGSFANCTNLEEIIIFCTTPPAFGKRGAYDSGMWDGLGNPKPLVVVPSGCKTAYEEAEPNEGETVCWNELPIVEGEPLDVTEVGWASFYTGVALDIPSCAKVYYASAAEGSTLTLTEITGTIPAETAVIVQIPAGTLFPVSESTPAAITGNLLRGTLTDIDKEDDVDVYVLSPASTKESPVFQNYTGDTLGAGKAYILKSDLNGTESNTLRFVFGETTHIEAVSADTNADVPMYNLQGQRVSDDYRGIVIKNGRKVMIR